MNLLELLLALYGWTGLLFAIAFALKGVERVDAAAKESTWGFRVMILPGAAALWPWLLAKWVRR